MKVKLFFVRGLYDTKEELGKWKTPFILNDSLCDVLKITEENFRRYTHVRGRGSDGMTIDWDLTDRPYSEIKLKIDRWGRSLFLGPTCNKANIELHTNIWDLGFGHLKISQQSDL